MLKLSNLILIDLFSESYLKHYDNNKYKFIMKNLSKILY